MSGFFLYDRGRVNDIRPSEREVDLELETDGKSQKMAVLGLAVMSLVWGYNWAIMKEALNYCGPFAFAAIRTFFGSLVLFFVLIVQGKDLRPKEIPLTILLGLLTTTGCIGVSTWALEFSGAGKTAILVYTMPFWLLILAWPILGERIRGIQWFAVTSAFIGLIAILEPWSMRGSPFGNFLGIVSGIFWAASAIVTKIIRQRSADFDLISITAWQLMFGALPLVVIAFTLSERPIEWTPFFTGAIIYNIIFTNAVALLLWFYSLHALPAGIAGMGTLATPVIGVLAASVQLGEIPSPVEAGGMFLILAGLALVSLPGILEYRRLRALIRNSG
jgi:drug/metabolite transporter (DMT)-like permease